MSEASLSQAQKQMLIKALKSDPVLRPLLSYTGCETESDIIVTSLWSPDRPLIQTEFPFPKRCSCLAKNRGQKVQRKSDLIAPPQTPTVVSGPLTPLCFSTVAPGKELLCLLEILYKE